MGMGPWSRRLAGLVVWVGVGLGMGPWGAFGAERLEVRDGDRVVFLGDTFFEREGVYGSIEARLTAAYPDRRVVFRNLAWAADTPMGRSRASFDWNKPGEEWLKRVREQVALVRPTVALLSYGMTAALEGGEGGVAGFLREMGLLMDTVEAVGEGRVRFVVVGPIQQAGERPDSERTRALEAVSRGLEGLAGERGAVYVDGLGLSRPLTRMPWNGYESPVVLNERGHAYVASGMVRALTGRAVTGEREEGMALLEEAIRHKNEQFFHRWRPANWTYLFGFRKHEQGRNAVEIPKFEPLVEEWDGRIATLRDVRRPDPATRSEVEAWTARARAGGEHAGRGDGGAEGFRPQGVPNFEVHPGYEVTLWAENPQLFKPIQMNWDPQGRLWVASSRIYPQIRPGQPAEDAVVVLEDTTGDGRADRSTVFAEGLVIPTGVVPDGKGGCYVGASHELLHLEDGNGDGRADRRRIVLSSFGTEDTHHNLHTLRWGYDGHLYMNQSIYTHTHIETPHGVRRLNSGGIWRFHPETWQLDVFTRGACNPWGHHWDRYGNHFFTDGAGFKGVYQAMEGATYFTYANMRREAESISPGTYPKFCGLEVLQSPMFPAEWQGQLVTCDFRAHRIVRFGLQEVGSTFRTVEMPDLLRTTDVSFRPIDVRMGPDGALYIADWSNPIIQHGEVDFRDPRRDKEHGRIWRVAATGSRRATREVDLGRLSTVELLERTLSANGWEQEQARVVLRHRNADEVLSAAESWRRGHRDPRAALEAVWLGAAFRRPSWEGMAGLAGSEDGRLRAAAARQLGR